MLPCQVPSFLPVCLLLLALYSNQTTVPQGTLLSPSLPSVGKRQGIWGLRGREVGKFPPGARAGVYIESVTSALIRASRALCLPAAVLYVGNCPVAALCQEESGSSQNLDFPSARAKDDCFVGLCLQVGPCSGHEIPCGDFRDPEGERRVHLPVCAAPGGSPSLSPSLPPRRSQISCLGGAQSRQQRCTAQPLPLLVLCGCTLPTRALILPSRLWWRWVASSARPHT